LFVGGERVKNRGGSITETAAVVASATLAGIACCGPVVIQWLGLLVWAIGGRLLMIWLVRHEIPVLGVIAATAFLSRRLARDPLARWANTLLAGTAGLFALMRLTWEIRRGIVMAYHPLLWLFSYRQSVLLAAGGLVLAARVTLLVAGLWHRVRSPRVCPASGAPGRRSTPERSEPVAAP
jgi:hypothetical protein